jgi:hypothetical protein
MHVVPARQGNRGEAFPAERGDRQLAVLDPQAGHAVVLAVKVAMVLQEVVLLGLRHARHAVHVVVSVALHVPQPQQGHQRQILLHRKPGLSCQVLA